MLRYGLVSQRPFWSDQDTVGHPEECWVAMETPELYLQPPHQPQGGVYPIEGPQVSTDQLDLTTSSSSVSPAPRPGRISLSRVHLHGCL